MNTGMPLSGQVRGLGKRNNGGGRNNGVEALTTDFETQKPTKAQREPDIYSQQVL